MHRQPSAVNAAIALTTRVDRPRRLTLATHGRAGNIRLGRAPPIAKAEGRPEAASSIHQNSIGPYRMIDVSELVTAIGLPALMTWAVWL
jgi:hypothetical protein